MKAITAPLVDPRDRPAFLALFAVFMVFGTSMTIIGAALPRILADFNWSYLVAGTVLAANAIAYFSFTFIGGYLISAWGPKRTLVLGLATAATGLLFFAATPDPLVNILLGALIGVGQGFVEIAVNWSTLRLDRAHSGRPMNLMHGAFAVGAILGPLALGGVLQAGLDWISVYRGMAAIFAGLAMVVLFVALPVVTAPGTNAARTNAAGTNAPGTNAPGTNVGTTPTEPPHRLGRQPAYWLSFLALFFYVGVELGVSNWVAQYFVAVFAYPVTASALLVSLFWAGLLAGRFGVPLLAHGARQDMMLVWFSALATLSITGLSLLGFLPVTAMTHVAGLGLVFLSGLGCSIFYPAVITLLGMCFPLAQSRAIGFAATGGGVGAFLFPFLMSALAQGWGIRAGFATYAGFGVAMTLTAAGLAVSARRLVARPAS